MYELFVRAASNREGKLELPFETGADPEASRVVNSLVDQGWLMEADGEGIWAVTPSGRFGIESLYYGDVVTFYKYAGAVFLLSTRSRAGETIVCHKGRSATISIAHLPYPEDFEVSKENEPVTMSGRFHMGNASAAACAFVTEDRGVPQPPKPEALRLQVSNYLNRF